VNSLDVQHRPARGLRSRLRGNDVPLYEVIGRRICPEVVVCLCLRVLESAGADKERAQYATVIGVGNERVLVVVTIRICHQVINYACQLLLVQRDADP
jgi:hypothetical protein